MTSLLVRILIGCSALCLSSAHATKPVAPPVSCEDSLLTIANPAYAGQCQGVLRGTIAAGQVATAVFDGQAFFLAGTSDTPGGAFASLPEDQTSGTLELAAPQAGLFVIGIKGGNSYSLYLFDGGIDGVSSIAFDTLGVVKGNGQPGPGLSHAGLFISAVPEPGAMTLMLAGLAAVGQVAHRRRRA